MFSADGLPAGLAIDSATGRITGTISSNADPSNPVVISLVSGDETAEIGFVWLALPAGVSNYVDIDTPGDRYLHEGENILIRLSTYNTLGFRSPTLSEICQAAQFPEGRAARRIPQPRGLVRTRCDDPRPIGAERR